MDRQQFINEAQRIINTQSADTDSAEWYKPLKGEGITLVRDLVVQERNRSQVHLHLRVDCKEHPDILDGMTVEFSDGKGLTRRSTIQRRTASTDLVPRGYYTMKLITKE